MISIKNLTKKFGETVALDDVSFEVNKGEVLGFLGPNGAGKTTTLRIITGFLIPSSGRVLVDNIDVQQNSLKIRKRIGYLAENNPLYLDMQTVEYLNFIANIRKLKGSEKQKKIKDVVEICGIGDVLSKNIGELSRGYKQRVGLSQALIHNPDILILDEPTSGLDPNQIAEIRILIKKIGKEKTVMLSTHILPEVSATCDRMVIINRGKIVASGTIEDLKRQTKGKISLYTEIKGPKDDILKELKTLEGIVSVDARNGGFEIGLLGGQDLREPVFDLAVRNNWVILELRKETAALEDVFRELTTKE